MMTRLMLLCVTTLAVGTTPAAANPGDYLADYRKKVRQMVADCDKKLHEAKDRLEVRKHAAECNRELDKLDSERRYEAAKDRREAEKRLRERQSDDDDNHGWHY